MRKNQKIDYPAIALFYNAQRPGGVVTVDRGTTLSNLHAALAARGLEKNVDYQARTKGKYLVIRKLSKLSMK